MKETDTLFLALKDFCLSFGVEVVCAGDQTDDRATWDTKTLDCTRADGADFVLHELAHCLTGLKSRPNYGLGGDPGGGSNTRQSVSDKRGKYYEDMALIGTLPLMVKFGCSDLAIRHYQSSYGFEYMTEREQQDAWVALQKYPKVSSILSKDQLQSLLVPDRG